MSPYDQETDALTIGANEHGRVADRYAAELIDKIGFPSTHEELVQALAVAYLDGQVKAIKWARNDLRGDDPRDFT